MPRLKDAAVVLDAIRSGVALLTWEQYGFAFADSFDEDEGRDRGWQAGQHVTVVDAGAPGLLVKPAVARGTRTLQRGFRPPHRFQLCGAAYLAVPEAIDFQAGRGWPDLRAACHRLLIEAERRIVALSDQPPISAPERSSSAMAAPAAAPRAPPIAALRCDGSQLSVVEHAASDRLATAAQKAVLIADMVCLVHPVSNLPG